MKKIRMIIALLLAMSMLALTGCGTKTDADTSGETEGNDAADTSDAADTTSFDYSGGIDDNGFWTGVKALDYVTLCDYKNIEIPADVHEIADDSVQTEIDTILSNNTYDVQITDRAIVDGDKVNIDYVGSVDGTEFENGSTNGAGTDVTIGVTNYIDDFIDQLIGHTPGDSFDVNVTFPDNYTNNEELSGKDAVFAVTINYITETVTPELTDEFVAEKLTESYGWTTVDEMKAGIRESLKNTAVQNYLQTYIVENSTVSEIPEVVSQYVVDSMLNYYQQYATSYSVDLDTFLSTYVGYDSTDALIEANVESNAETGKYYMVIQAIAEDLEVNTGTTEITEYFVENMDTEDYSQYEEYYGLPYLAQVVLYSNILGTLTDGSTLA